MKTFVSRTNPAETVVDALTDLQAVLERLNPFEFEQVQETLANAVGNLIEFIKEHQ